MWWKHVKIKICRSNVFTKIQHVFHFCYATVIVPLPKNRSYRWLPRVAQRYSSFTNVTHRYTHYIPYRTTFILSLFLTISAYSKINVSKNMHFDGSTQLLKMILSLFIPVRFRTPPKTFFFAYLLHFLEIWRPLQSKIRISESEHVKQKSTTYRNIWTFFPKKLRLFLTIMSRYVGESM